MATGLVNGEWQNSTPQNPHCLTDQQKFVTGDYVGDPYGCAKFGANPPTRSFWEKYNKDIFYLYLVYAFLVDTCTGQTSRRIFTMVAQTTWSRTKVRLLEFVDIALNFWGLNRSFQAKRAKYWKCHIIETTASIPTKFCITIETTN